MGTAGIGSIMRRWNGTPPGAWENIAQITNIAAAGISVDMLEDTSLDNIDRYKTFVAGMIDPGEVTLSLNFTRDEYEQMKADAENQSNQNYEIVLSDVDNTSFEFEAHVSSLSFTLEPNGIITSECVMQVSGKTNLESGSGPSEGA